MQTTDSQPTELQQLQAENEQLRQRVAELSASKDAADAILRAQGRAARWLAGFGMRISIGRGLNDSLYSLVHTVRREHTLPDRELADVIAAVIRRWLRTGLVSLIGALVALVTVGLLLWQNVLIQRQLAQQAQISDTARRAELLATLYNRRDCGADDPESCPLSASLRARTEAAIAFVQLERPTDSSPDLESVDLRQADLSSADFAGVNFGFANLSDAILVGANLNSADLALSDLRNTTMMSTDLRNARLFKADLTGATILNLGLSGAMASGGVDLSGADMIGAKLSGLNLSGANLSESKLSLADLSGARLLKADLSSADLTDAVLNGTLYDEFTLWPSGFDPEAVGAIKSPLPTPVPQ